jgi:hypothetical protein
MIVPTTENISFAISPDDIRKLCGLHIEKTQVRIPLTDLIDDPVVQVDEEQLEDLVDDIRKREREGEFPALHFYTKIIADQKNKRIVWGHHLYRAYRRHGGFTEVAVELRAYNNEVEFLKDKRTAWGNWAKEQWDLSWAEVSSGTLKVRFTKNKGVA